MQELLKISYEAENPTVSARELYDRLNIKSNFTTWFRRMCEYGFEDGKDFFPKMEESTGGRPSEEFAMKIDMAKEICMLQRSPEGKRIRQYFIDLEKAWNTPEQIFARALKMADKTIEELKHNNAALEVQRDGKGYSGKTGKAVFSDGTYLEYVNGFLVGGNTKEGGF